MFDSITAVSNVGGRYELHVTPVSTSTEGNGVENVAAVSLRLFLPNGEGGYVRIDTINGTLRHWVSKGTHTVNWGNSRNFAFPDALLGKGMNDVVGPNVILAILAKTHGKKIIVTFYKDEEGKLNVQPKRTTQQLTAQTGAILNSIENKEAEVAQKEIFVGDEDEAPQAQMNEEGTPTKENTTE